ncbi:MAG: low molecular weight protein arginine phosphatase [Sedimentibacter sp.]|uniref:low molecular weight protein arginine phosphatase n=1 Tax=Sedimentibacter sp. TaxID=1960295 RepID=UPI0031592C01
MNILLVCTGNTCRSSMAEGIFKHMLKINNIDHITVSSAGLSAFEGDIANEKAIEVLKRQGIDISGHKSRQLTAKLIDDSDLILTMTAGHKAAILKYAPGSGNKVYTLREYAGKNGRTTNRSPDIHDPYGMDYSVYESVMNEIRIEIESIINKLKEQ